MKVTHFTLQELYNQGHRTLKSLMKINNYPKSTIARNLKKIREGISLERKPGTGKAPLLKPNDRKRLIQLALRNDMNSSSDLAAKLFERGSPKVAPNTIRKCLNMSGLFCRPPNYVPKLTPLHKVNRVNWCQPHS